MNSKPFVALCFVLASLGAHAEWIFQDSHALVNSSDEISIPRYHIVTGLQSPIDGGEAYQYLYNHPGESGKFYIAVAGINVENRTNWYYTSSAAREIDSVRMWRWEWNGAPGGEQGQIFEYNVRGRANAEVYIEVDEGGCGYFEAAAAVYVSAVTAGSTGEDNAAGVAVGGEVNEDDYSITGIGVSVDITGGGGEIQWDEPDPQQYEAIRGESVFAPIDGMPWAGTVNYIQIQTYARANAGRFQDTFHENNAQASAYMDYSFPFHRLIAPY